MIHEGSWVKVNIKSDDECFGILGKYNGQLMKVVKAKRIRGDVYYELEGAVSSKGIPYAFTDDILDVQEGLLG